MATVRVLVLEDNLADARLMRHWLTGEVSGQYHVAFASRVAEAIELIRRESFDVVLADLSLPDSEGMATVAALDEHLGDTALVVLTGNDNEEQAVRSLRQGCQDFLVKGHADGFIVRRAINYALERKRLELALARSESRFRDFARAASDWFWEVGTELTFTYVSEASEQFTGLAPDALTGRMVFDLAGYGIDAADLTVLDQLLQSREPFQNFVYRRVLVDTTARFMRISGVPFSDARGRFGGYRGAGSDVTEQRLLEDRIHHMALFDTLTDLPNRALFHDALVRAGATADRRQEATAVLYLDLDGFKEINDTYGHDAGDALLAQVAKRLQDGIRGNDTVARLGGDEFGAVIVVSRERAREEATTVATRMLSALEQPFEIPGGVGAIGASIGIALYPLDGDTVSDCLRKADVAMYAAKRQGKNRFVFAEALPDTPTLCLADVGARHRV